MAIHENVEWLQVLSRSRVAPPRSGELMFAHASGFSWDEALLIVAPLAIIAGFLVIARRRIRRGGGGGGRGGGGG